MRVLILCDVLFPQTTGGAGRVARELAKALQELGHPIQFLTRRTPRVPSPDSIPTTYFPPPGRALLQRYRRIFQRTCDHFNPEIILSHQPLAAFLCIPAGFPKPVVSVFHSSWPREFQLKSSFLPRPVRWLASPLLAGVERKVLSGSRAIVVLSEYSRAEVKGRYQLESLIIPGGVNTKRFLPSERRQPDGIVHLITLRNLVPRMGLRALIEAIFLLPSGVQLDIGGEGPLRGTLEQRIQSLGLDDRIHLLGHIPESDLAHFYSSADWFVLPTLELEGFGLVILESLSSGTPVMGTRIGAIPELLERFEPSWVISEPTARSIAGTIETLIQTTPPDPWRLHRQVAAEFGWHRIAQHYLELFRRLL